MKRNSAITLLELIIAISLLGVVALGFTSIQNFARYHAIGSERRAKVQNELSFVLQHISKNIQRATGDGNNPPIAALANGFRVRVDANPTPTPANYGDDTWYNYTLSGNTFYCNGEALSAYIVSGVNSSYPASEPANVGFNYGLLDSGVPCVAVMLRGRYSPSSAVNADNPEITMGSRFCSVSASSNH